MIERRKSRPCLKCGSPSGWYISCSGPCAFGWFCNEEGNWVYTRNSYGTTREVPDGSLLVANEENA